MLRQASGAPRRMAPWGPRRHPWWPPLAQPALLTVPARRCRGTHARRQKGLEPRQEMGRAEGGPMRPPPALFRFSLWLQSFRASIPQGLGHRAAPRTDNRHQETRRESRASSTTAPTCAHVACCMLRPASPHRTPSSRRRVSKTHSISFFNFDRRRRKDDALIQPRGRPSG